jgi:hypothetical protein
MIEFGLLVLEEKSLVLNFQFTFTVSLLSPLGDEQSPSFEQT